MKILIAEDDAQILAGLADIFQREGYDTIATTNGTEALERFDQDTPDVVCLDIMMPGLNGYDVCTAIRKQNPHVPILFISAKSEEIDRVVGLELGADDFIVKPFGVREVVARIRAVTRRYLRQTTPETQDDAFTMADLTIYPAQLRAYRGEETIELSLRDVKILTLLRQHTGEVVDRHMLLDACWGTHIMPDSRTVDQHISQLRKRIEIDPKQPVIIRTVHGAGYRYDT
jgi:two-component system, OmpR family, alkaline phosphatase synthesis response regulator PhoP